MTVTVEGPGGATIDFPDGTDAAIIHEVMSQHFGGDGNALTDIVPEAKRAVLETTGSAISNLGDAFSRRYQMPAPTEEAYGIGLRLSVADCSRISSATICTKIIRPSTFGIQTPEPRQVSRALISRRPATRWKENMCMRCTES